MPLVEFGNTGRATKLIKRAIADLESVDLWRPLTRHLYLVKFAIYERGSQKDNASHLANALSTVVQDDAGEFQLACDIVFFSRTISAESRRYQRYLELGYTAKVPATLRLLYAEVVAHELAHCLEGKAGEKVARRWGRKALNKLERDR